MIAKTSLPPENYLGPVMDVSFSNVVVLCKLDQKYQGPGIVSGSFAIMVHHTQASGVFDNNMMPPPSELLSRESFVLLRLLEIKPLPESSTRLGRRCDQIIAIDADPADPDATHCLLNYAVLGAYVQEDAASGIRFCGDPGSLGTSGQYCAYLPSHDITDILVNGVINPLQRIRYGRLRTSEALPVANLQHEVFLSMLDIRGKRTAIFGKTRLGKSNALKLVIQGMLDVTRDSKQVGQLIFDVNGEYANDNPQDNNLSIASIYSDRSLVYHLMARGGNQLGHLLRFNFYEQSHLALSVFSELLPANVTASEYVQPLLNCRIPAFEAEPGESEEALLRRIRKIMMFWTVLDAAGFEFSQAHLAERLTQMGIRFPFNPQFRQALRMNAYQAILSRPCPPPPNNFRDMAQEMTTMAQFMLVYSNDPELNLNNQMVFDLDEHVMARFLKPQFGAGPYVLRSCVPFHSPVADNFFVETLAALSEGKTVIIDLGSAKEQIVRYFSKVLSTAVFQAQEERFVSNTLDQRFVQVYFEEAHMIFPNSSEQATDIYSRFAKEGAKFNIGIAYSTQSPSSVNKDLLAQTENFFIGHLSSRIETQLLSSVQVAFQGLEDDIMHARSPGYLRVLTASHRYPVPVQVARFTGESLLVVP